MPALVNKPRYQIHLSRTKCNDRRIAIYFKQTERNIYLSDCHHFQKSDVPAAVDNKSKKLWQLSSLTFLWLAALCVTDEFSTVIKLEMNYVYTHWPITTTAPPCHWTLSVLCRHNKFIKNSKHVHSTPFGELVMYIFASIFREDDGAAGFHSST